MEKLTKDGEPDLRHFIRSADKVADELGSNWTEGAACSAPDVDPDLWLPSGTIRDKESRAKAKEAVNICFNECPIRLDCLKAACLGGEKFGIWGGLNWTTRRGEDSPRAPHDYEELAKLPNPYE